MVYVVFYLFYYTILDVYNLVSLVCHSAFVCHYNNSKSFLVVQFFHSLIGIFCLH